MRTIYIAGKITGLPFRRTYLKFLLREIMLLFYGFKPTNPMRDVPNDWEYGQQMSMCLYLVHENDCIYLSHNWRNSPGAKKELKTYIDRGKTEIYMFDLFGLRKITKKELWG
jgi:hypothetical protein